MAKGTALLAGFVVWCAGAQAQALSDPHVPDRLPGWGEQPKKFSTQGPLLQGFELADPEVLVRFRYQGMTYQGEPLQDVHIERGGLVARVPWELRAAPGLSDCGSRTLGGRRGCGWKLAAVGECAPRTAVTVGASSAAGLGDSSGRQMLRICSGNRQTCNHAKPVYARALASAGMIAASRVDASEEGGPLVHFLCPRSGQFLVMAADYDSAEPTQVNLAAENATLAPKYLTGADMTGVLLQGILDDGRELTFGIALAARDYSAWSWLYQLVVSVDGSTWSSACEPQGENAPAIVTSGVWDAAGMRYKDPTSFTFSCPRGAIAKCYRWGYRPWAAADAAVGNDLHRACTRMARADFCGNGEPHTVSGVWVDYWDTVPPPIATPSPTWPEPIGFEAAWSPDGALCLNGDVVAEPCASGASGVARFGLSNLCADQTAAETLGRDEGVDVHFFSASCSTRATCNITPP